MLPRLAPILFVLIWSTGWITGRAAADLGDPLTWLLARYALAAVALAAVMALFKVPLPRDRRVWLHAAASGVLLHAIYLGGVWYVVSNGLATPLSGVIAAIQPLLTAALAVAWLGEHLTRRQWLGLGLGLVGLMVALLPRLAGLEGDALRTAGWLIAINVVAMVSVTLGSLYQKRYLQTGDLRAITFLQYIGAALATLPAALLLEDMTIVASWQSVLVMAWAVLGLSMGAIGLYLYMIRNGAVSKVASLIYLIPPLVAVQAFLLFDEGLEPIAIAGMLITVFGVYLVNRKPALSAPRAGEPG